MEKLQASQLAKVVLLLLLLIITPFVSTSMRPSYTYFLLNILIVVLGLEAGFFTAISGPRGGDERKPATIVAPLGAVTLDVVPENSTVGGNAIESIGAQLLERPVEKPVVEEIIAVARVRKLKRCPTATPSLFYIEGDDEERAKEEVEVKEVEEDDVGAQELFAKAEMFIGNFYKQLKMQREESWKKIHGLYHRAS